MDDRPKLYREPARGDLLTRHVGYMPSEKLLDPPEVVYVCEEQVPRKPTAFWGLFFQEQPSEFAKTIFSLVLIAFVWAMISCANAVAGDILADFLAAIAPQAVR